MQIACLHTTALHQVRFSALFEEQAPDASIVHVVRDDLLTQAQITGVEALADPVFEVLGSLIEADAVLCTCSTLGPLVDMLQHPKIVRIDRPLMEAAAAIGPKPLIVASLESVRTAAVALYDEVRGPDCDAGVLVVEEAWPLFVRGDHDAYVASIVAEVSKVAAGHDCVVLAQASMADAVPHLQELGVPVLSSPALAVARTLAVGT